MKKFLMFAGAALVGVAIGTSAAYAKDMLDKPAAVVPCASSQSSSALTVRKGCEASEQSNIKEVTALLERLPSELGSGKSSSLTEEAAKRDFKNALPANAKITAYPDSWRRTGTIGSLTVKVKTVPFLPKSHTYLAIFEKTTSGWKLSETLEPKAAR